MFNHASLSQAKSKFFKEMLEASFFYALGALH
jgi:hypothetical protein